MTVASTTNRKTFAGDDATTSFGTSPVVFYDTDDLTVYVTDDDTGDSTLLVENTDYTVTGGSGSTGTISLAGGSDPWGALVSDTTLVIVRELDLVQEFDPQNNDSSDAENQEDAFDKITMMLQQLNSRLGRAVVLLDSDVSGAVTNLPLPEAGKLLGWDALAEALRNYSIEELELAIGGSLSDYLLLAGGTMTGNIVLQTVHEQCIQANSSTSYAANLATANVFDITLTGNCTFTFTNPAAAGYAHSFTLMLTQDGTGSRTVTWPASVKWPSASAPTITPTAGRKDIFTFMTTDGGTKWNGFVSGQNYS